MCLDYGGRGVVLVVFCFFLLSTGLLGGWCLLCELYLWHRRGGGGIPIVYEMGMGMRGGGGGLMSYGLGGV